MKIGDVFPHILVPPYRRLTGRPEGSFSGIPWARRTISCQAARKPFQRLPAPSYRVPGGGRVIGPMRLLRPAHGNYHRRTAKACAIGRVINGTVITQRTFGHGFNKPELSTMSDHKSHRSRGRHVSILALFTTFVATPRISSGRPCKAASTPL